MRKIYLILLGLFSINAYSQSTSLHFSYDASGNQILRDVVCINCGKANLITEEMMEEKLSVLKEGISAAPNPVTQKLHVQWIFEEENPLQQFQIRNMNGGLLKSIPVRSNSGSLEIDFSPYSKGMYILAGLHLNNKISIIKIIKK